MSTRKITARLRTEDTDRLPQLLLLYANDAQAVALIQAEIDRRRMLANQLKYRQSLPFNDEHYPQTSVHPRVR